MSKRGKINMFPEKIAPTRSIARKLAREILPEEMDIVAAGTSTLCAGGFFDDCDNGPCGDG
jgi:hypothetical protein